MQSDRDVTKQQKLEEMDGPTQEEVDALHWFHVITFPNGVKTRGEKGGGELSQRAEAEVIFRYPVSGKTVLDIGAWNGYFSIEAVRRGAKRVVALDKPSWQNPALQGYKGFSLARRYLAPSIVPVCRDLMDLRSDPVGKFDCVLFLGVLYHLKHPLYALETISDITLEHLVLETHIDMTEYDRPAMTFYRFTPNGKGNNWWAPNVKCVIDMLRAVGFSRIEHVAHPLHPNRAFFHAFRHG
ncbi:MAG TPA: DUF1698 domain-containing protein [Stellaceae bacterium]|nr:DUF1698 domain-containing protein [Stellaceae bacterium]